MNAERYVNCTPHSINVFASDGKTNVMTFPQSKFIARIEQLPQKEIGRIFAKVPIVDTPAYGQVIGLPDVAGDIIVSMDVAHRLCETRQWSAGKVLVPDTSPDGVVRDDNGQIVGTKRLVKYC